jgi:hypothetical protein
MTSVVNVATMFTRSTKSTLLRCTVDVRRGSFATARRACTTAKAPKADAPPPQSAEERADAALLVTSRRQGPIVVPRHSIGPVWGKVCGGCRFPLSPAPAMKGALAARGPIGLRTALILGEVHTQATQPSVFTQPGPGADFALLSNQTP